MEQPTQQELLEHYARRAPFKFLQVDGFSDAGHDPHQMFQGDKDGHVLFSGETWELMSGAPDVRLLISSTAKREDVLLLLSKIKSWVDSYKFFLE